MERLIGKFELTEGEARLVLAASRRRWKTARRIARDLSAKLRDA